MSGSIISFYIRRTLKKTVSKVKSYKKLTESSKGTVGRNSGRISVRHRQRGRGNLT